MFQGLLQKPIGVVALIATAAGGPYFLYETEAGRGTRKGLESMLYSSTDDVAGIDSPAEWQQNQPPSMANDSSFAAQPNNSAPIEISDSDGGLFNLGRWLGPWADRSNEDAPAVARASFDPNYAAPANAHFTEMPPTAHPAKQFQWGYGNQLANQQPPSGNSQNYTSYPGNSNPEYQAPVGYVAGNSTPRNDDLPPQGYGTQSAPAVNPRQDSNQFANRSYSEPDNAFSSYGPRSNPGGQSTQGFGSINDGRPSNFPPQSRAVQSFPNTPEYQSSPSPPIGGVNATTFQSSGPNSLRGQTITDLREVIRFDISPGWVPQRFQNVTTVLADKNLDALQVPLVTGASEFDINALLTYYFDASRTVKRIQLVGRTANAAPMAALMQQYYGLQSQPSLGGHLYTTRWNNNVTCLLHVAPAPMQQPGMNDRYAFVLELNQPSLAYGLSEQATSILNNGRNNQQWQ